MAAGRGAMLLLVAVVLGIFLLNRTDDSAGTTVSQTPGTTQARKTGVTTTTVASITTTTRPTHDPATVKVLAVNGTATPGVGARIKDVLLTAKFNTLSPTDAKTKPVKATVVYYQPGYDVDAVAIARLFGFDVANTKPLPATAADMVKTGSQIANANVVVMGGDDVIAKLPAKAATSSTTGSTTSTTKKPAASSTTTAKPAGSSTTSTTTKP
jgi:hypothetical protein